MIGTVEVDQWRFERGLRELEEALDMARGLVRCNVSREVYNAAVDAFETLRDSQCDVWNVPLERRRRVKML